LQAQIRRAAALVPTNIVEGSARRSTRDDGHSLTVALGSLRWEPWEGSHTLPRCCAAGEAGWLRTRASEARYLIGLAHRLRMMRAEDHDLLAARYGDLLRAMEKLIAALDQRT
jgi:hypothetical protein